MNEGKHVESLISEYTSLIKNPPLSIADQNAKNSISKTLVRKADWTEKGADELLMLVNDYGAFMLRNALALAVVLNREDGNKLF